jgi:hypothetical protein
MDYSCICLSWQNRISMNQFNRRMRHTDYSAIVRTPCCCGKSGCLYGLKPSRGIVGTLGGRKREKILCVEWTSCEKTIAGPVVCVHSSHDKSATNPHTSAGHQCAGYADRTELGGKDASKLCRTRNPVAVATADTSGNLQPTALKNMVSKHSSGALDYKDVTMREDAVKRSVGPPNRYTVKLR